MDFQNMIAKIQFYERLRQGMVSLFSNFPQESN